MTEPSDEEILNATTKVTDEVVDRHQRMIKTVGYWFEFGLRIFLICFMLIAALSKSFEMFVIGVLLFIALETFIIDFSLKYREVSKDE